MIWDCCSRFNFWPTYQCFADRERCRKISIRREKNKLVWTHQYYLCIAMFTVSYFCVQRAHTCELGIIYLFLSLSGAQVKSIGHTLQSNNCMNWREVGLLVTLYIYLLITRTQIPLEKLIGQLTRSYVVIHWTCTVWFNCQRNGH